MSCITVRTKHGKTAVFNNIKIQMCNGDYEYTFFSPVMFMIYVISRIPYDHCWFDNNIDSLQLKLQVYITCGPCTYVFDNPYL